MNWRVTRSPHTVELILALPVEGQLALLDLIEALERDPFAVTEPYGIDDHVTRQALFGDAGLAVLFVNGLTQRITVSPSPGPADPPRPSAASGRPHPPPAPRIELKFECVRGSARMLMDKDRRVR